MISSQQDSLSVSQMDKRMFVNIYTLPFLDFFAVCHWRAIEVCLYQKPVYIIMPPCEVNQYIILLLLHYELSTTLFLCAGSRYEGCSKLSTWMWYNAAKDNQRFVVFQYNLSSSVLGFIIFWPGKSWDLVFLDLQPWKKTSASMSLSLENGHPFKCFFQYFNRQ